MQLTDKQIARFWQKVSQLNENGCRLWIGTRSTPGYGAVFFTVAPYRDLQYRAHRVALGLATGVDPDETELKALHHCDVQLCCEPSHLYWGTTAQNQQDMKRRGRSTRGEKSGMAVLTDQAVIGIKDLLYHGETLREIAEQYGVSISAIWAIKCGQTWSHINALRVYDGP